MRRAADENLRVGRAASLRFRINRKLEANTVRHNCCCKQEWEMPRACTVDCYAHGYKSRPTEPVLLHQCGPQPALVEQYRGLL